MVFLFVLSEHHSGFRRQRMLRNIFDCSAIPPCGDAALHKETRDRVGA